MSEFNPTQRGIPEEHDGEIIFDENGNPIGIAITGDGSLDYADRTDGSKDVILVIRPRTHNEEQ